MAESTMDNRPKVESSKGFHIHPDFTTVRVEAFLDECDAIRADHLMIHTMRHLPAAHIPPEGAIVSND